MSWRLARFKRGDVIVSVSMTNDRLPETCIGWFGKRLDEMGAWRLSLRVANAWIS
jgi:hypothetical protein